MYRVKPLGGGHSQTKGPRMRQHRLCKKTQRNLPSVFRGHKIYLQMPLLEKGGILKLLLRSGKDLTPTYRCKTTHPLHLRISMYV